MEPALWDKVLVPVGDVGNANPPKTKQTTPLLKQEEEEEEWDVIHEAEKIVDLDGTRQTKIYFSN